MGLFSSRKSNSSSTNTTNQDNKVTVQDGLGLSNSSGNTVSYNSTDAVQAIAQLGSDTFKNMGESIVQLNATSTENNALAWDKTLTTSAALIDRLIDGASESYGLAATAINKFQPTENKAQDSMKYGLIAAAAVGAALILKSKK